MRPHLAVQLGCNGYGILGPYPEARLNEAFERLRSVGVPGVEMMLAQLAVPTYTAAALRRHDLHCTALHVFSHEIDSPTTAAEIVLAAQRVSAPRLIVSYTGQVETSRDLTDEVAFFAQVVARHAADTELCIHPHEGEYRQDGDVDRFEFLRDKLAPLGVRAVIDTYWAWKAGRDPLMLVREHADWCDYLHLKDGTVASRAVDIGLGDVEVLRCAQEALTLNPAAVLVLEQDGPAGDLGEIVRRVTQMSARERADA